MSTLTIFLSYSHADEWLKNEFIAAMSGLTYEGKAILWHDRMILAGQNFNDEIDDALYRSSLFVMLLSNNFIASNYCMNVEFKEALQRKKFGEMEILPVIARPCDWKIDPIKPLRVAPIDGKPVNPVGAKREDTELRDDAWLEVVKDARSLIEKIQNKNNPIKLKDSYRRERTKEIHFFHSSKAEIQLKDLFIDPELVLSNEDARSLSTKDILDQIERRKTVLVTGDDQSGKSTLLYRIQELLLDKGIPAVVIKGEEIKNLNLERFIKKAASEQFEKNDYVEGELCVLIDDLEAVRLPERALKHKIEELCHNYKSLVATSFARLQSYFFIDMDIDDPISVNIEQLPPNRVYELVERWVRIGSIETTDVDTEAHVAFQSVIGIAQSGYIPCYPSLVTNLLRVLHSASGSDVALTSNSACYDAVVTLELKENKVPLSEIDRVKNALGYIAYEVFRTGVDGELGIDKVNNVLKGFEEKYLVDMKVAFQLCQKAKIVFVNGERFRFANKLLLYFFIGKHLAEQIRQEQPLEYKQIISNCISEIRRRDYANIILFCLYFSSDSEVLGNLCQELDRLFNQSKYWKIDSSVDERMVVGEEFLKLAQSTFAPNEERMLALSEEHAHFVSDQQALAEQYVSPFSSVAVELETGNAQVDEGTYLGEMNALFRLQTVIAAGINTRAGTFDRKVIVSAVDAMVRAAGRFAHTNLLFASQFKADPKAALEQIKTEFPETSETTLSEISDKERRRAEAKLRGIIERILEYFTQWSVIVAQGVVGRCLAEQSTIKATEILHKQHECDNLGQLLPDKPYNFSSALIIAKLWKSGKIDKADFEAILKTYGHESHIRQVLRFSLFVFSRYMPIDSGERQWLDEKMKIPIDETRVRQRKLPGKSKKPG